MNEEKCNCMNEEKCNCDTAKTYVIAIINGDKYSSPTLQQLTNELKPAMEFICNLSEYSDIAEFVQKAYPNEENITGKIISTILQVDENALLELYVEFCKNRGLIKNNNEIALIFYGFQLLNQEGINQDLLTELREYGAKN